MLYMKTALTADIGILEAGITALLGYAVVFFGLVLLMAVVMGLGKVMMATNAKPLRSRRKKPRALPVPSCSTTCPSGKLPWSWQWWLTDWASPSISCASNPSGRSKKNEI